MGHAAQPGGGVDRRCSGARSARLGLAVAAADRRRSTRRSSSGCCSSSTCRRAASCRLTPFLDLVLIWNRGISYGLFQQDGPLGQWALLALTAVAVVLLWIWLARSTSRLTALSLGLIIGGAVGNAIDRVAYGAVADFVLLHLTTASFSFKWYVFNLADAAIVAGVAGLLYDSLAGRRAAKQP